MQIEACPRSGEQTADVKLAILSDGHSVYLEGIVARQPRSGWITLDSPPLEAWEQPLHY